MSTYLDIGGRAAAREKTHAAATSSCNWPKKSRQELIAGLAKGGGHLGPNLGVVELTVALHRVFTTPKDKFVWDVSHQVYVHKIFDRPQKTASAPSARRTA